MNSIKNISKAFLLAASLLASLCACRRDIDYELGYEGDRLVVNGVISPQRVVAVSISRSNAPSGEAPADLSVTGATVQLFENETLVEQLVHRQQGLYVSASGFKPRPGYQYALRVTAPGLPPAETQPALVPHNFTLENFSFRTGLNSYYNPSKPATELEIALQDSAQTIDYYRVEIRAYYNRETLVPTIWLVGETEEAGQPCTRFTNGSFIYRDRCFNGTSYRSIIGVETSGFVTQNSQDFNEVDFQQLRVRVQRISDNYYRYLESNNLNQGIGLAFFEPAFLHSNVTGGFGIWAAVNEQEKFVPLP